MSIRYDIPLFQRLLRAAPTILVYLLLVLGIWMLMPKDISELSLKSIAILGIIGIWRYLWLITHVIRASIYEHLKFPKLRFEAESLPENERFPKRLFIVIPTYGEKPEVSEQMLNSVLDEAANIPSETIIYINAGSDEEDAIFKRVHAEHSQSEKATLHFIRQVGGKRSGMADVLYAIRERETIEADDVSVLMDGDTVLGKDIYEKCLPLFKLKPKLGAVTTDNISVTKGNWFYRKWYTLRFAMRHRMMKSQSVSNQILVLTGRFSIFRTQHTLTDSFISHLENDRISHWLQGEIKFLTGDDKSTWFALLREGCEMLYVPDAHIYCMEDSGKQPFRQSIAKMRRWFGNMLRNNGRALRLGVGAQKPFIWYCQLDQRISMFTSLLGPIGAIWTAIWISPYYLLIYAMIVILVRMIYLLLLAIEGHRISIVDVPLLLYTQWGGSIVKIYTLFHLHIQKWDDHRTDGKKAKHKEPFFNRMIPKLQIAFSMAILVALVAVIVGIE